MKVRILAPVMLAAAAAFNLSPAYSADFEWRFVSSFGPADIASQLHRDFAHDLEESSGGRLKITFYAGGELPYKGSDMLRVLRNKQVEMAHMSVGFIAGDLPAINALSMPFECMSPDDFYDKAMPAVEGLVSKAMNDKFQATPIMNFVMPAQQLWIDRPVNSLEDLKGAKIRAWNREQNEVMRLLDGAGVSITSAEVTPALQRGVVNGAFTAAINAEAWKLYEVVKYGYMLDLSLSHEIIAVNNDAFSKLPPDLQKTVRDVSDRWVSIYRKKLISADTDVRDTLVSRGMTLQAPSEADTARLRELTRPLGDAWAEKTGPVAKEMLDSIRANCS